MLWRSFRTESTQNNKLTIDAESQWTQFSPKTLFSRLRSPKSISEIDLTSLASEAKKGTPLVSKASSRATSFRHRMSFRSTHWKDDFLSGISDKELKLWEPLMQEQREAFGKDMLQQLTDEDEEEFNVLQGYGYTFAEAACVMFNRRHQLLIFAPGDIYRLLEVATVNTPLSPRRSPKHFNSKLSSISSPTSAPNSTPKHVPNPPQNPPVQIAPLSQHLFSHERDRRRTATLSILSEDEQCAFIMLLSAQEEIYGTNMFDCFTDADESIIVALLAEGYAYSDIVRHLFQQRYDPEHPFPLNYPYSVDNKSSFNFNNHSRSNKSMDSSDDNATHASNFQHHAYPYESSRDSYSISSASSSSATIHAATAFSFASTDPQSNFRRNLSGNTQDLFGAMSSSPVHAQSHQSQPSYHLSSKPSREPMTINIFAPLTGSNRSPITSPQHHHQQQEQQRLLQQRLLRKQQQQHQHRNLDTNNNHSTSVASASVSSVSTITSDNKPSMSPKNSFRAPGSQDGSQGIGMRSPMCFHSPQKSLQQPKASLDQYSENYSDYPSHLRNNAHHASQQRAVAPQQGHYPYGSISDDDDSKDNDDDNDALSMLPLSKPPPSPRDPLVKTVSQLAMEDYQKTIAKGTSTSTSTGGDGSGKIGASEDGEETIKKWANPLAMRRGSVIVRRASLSVNTMMSPVASASSPTAAGSPSATGGSLFAAASSSASMRSDVAVTAVASTVQPLHPTSSFTSSPTSSSSPVPASSLTTRTSPNPSPRSVHKPSPRNASALHRRMQAVAVSSTTPTNHNSNNSNNSRAGEKKAASVFDFDLPPPSTVSST